MNGNDFMLSATAKDIHVESGDIAFSLEDYSFGTLDGNQAEWNFFNDFFDDIPISGSCNEQNLASRIR